MLDLAFNFKSRWRSFICLIFLSLQADCAMDERVLNERRLLNDLFVKQGYNPLIRPVQNTNDSLKVEFSLALSQIINVDEVNQVMKTNVWLQVYWTDFQLSWNSFQYGDIDSVRVKPEKMWVPDLVLYNNADGNYEVTYKSNCVVYSDGSVHWIPPAIYQSSCYIDVLYFPFDQQVCEMQFGSWTHRGKSLIYIFYENMDKLDLTDYLPSGSWDIIDCPGRIETVVDHLTLEKKEVVIFQFVLRRKTLFYTVNLIIPCILVSLASICVFVLPADAGEKITLCISILLALVVFLLLVSKILPPSLTIPLIAKYLLFTFIMNIITVFFTVIVINRNHRTPRTHEMPRWVRVVFLRELPKFLFMKRPDHDKRWEGSSQPSCLSSSFPCTPQPKRAAVANPVHRNLPSHEELLQLDEYHHPECTLSSRGTELEGWSSPQAADHRIAQNHQMTMTPELGRTIEAVKFIYYHLKTEEEYGNVLEDWKYVARVMDRLLLIVFLTVTLMGTAGILLNAPYILEYVDQDKILREIIESMNSSKNA